MTNINLNKKIENNYIQLRDYLRNQKWKDSDLQTRKLMLIITGANERRDILLTQDDLNNFSCKHLQFINNLWVKYSNGYFGFSVINNIYQESNQDYHLLAKIVGWQNNNEWITSENINFSLKAPQGHLPLTWLIPTTFSIYWSARFASAGWGLILKRIDKCNHL